MSVPTLLSKEDVLERFPAIKPRTLRHWVNQAKPRTVHRGGKAHTQGGNGLEPALVRKGRLVFFREDRFLEWLLGEAS